MRTRLTIFLCAAVLSASGIAQQAAAQQMTARELFYRAAPDAAPAQPAAAVKKKLPAKRPSESAQTAESKAPAPVQQSSSPSSAPSAPVVTAGQPMVINAAMRTSAPPPSTGTPLGLKYTILKLEGANMVPVAPDAVFHTNDKIQFSIESNGPGYLYIVSRGSSGEWQPMFPSEKIDGGDNHIEGFHDYVFPAGYRYSFDEQPGAERLFLILSRDPKPDFEQLVYSLQDRTAPARTVDETVHPKTEAPQPHRSLVASNISDSTIDKFRNVYARDLVIEKVGDQPAADSKEKAVFVVNASGTSDSCVVADLTLAHR